MHNQEIKVSVVKYPDRKFFMMRYTDPITGKHKARSTGTVVRREAERIAAKWEQQLQAGLYQPPQRISWPDFRERYEAEKLSSLAAATRRSAASALNQIERVINPDRLEKLTSTVLSQFQAKLREEEMRCTTLSRHLRHIRAALSWTVSMGMLPKIPDVHPPVVKKGRS